MKQPVPRRNAKPGSPGKPTFGKKAGGKRPTAKPFDKVDGPPKRSFGKAEVAEKRPFGKAKVAEKRPFSKAEVAETRPFGKAEVAEKRPFSKAEVAEKRTFGKPSVRRPFERTKDDATDFDRPLDADRKPEHRAKRAPLPRRRLEAALDFDDVIYGVHSIEEALRAGEKINRLYVGRERERDPILREMLALAKTASVQVVFEGAPFFARFPYKAHQNVVAIGEPFVYISLDEAIGIRKTERLIVILDHLTDPHNVGAILRTAECAGAQAVVLPDRRSAGINATVRKGAAGAASHLPVAKVGNISAAIRALKAAGFTVVGAALEEQSFELSRAPMGDDLALVIGAEGSGLSKLVAKNCDQLVKIPLLGKVESLNASVAAGVLLYEIVRRRVR